LNIIRKDIDELNTLIEVELTKDDYLPQVKDSLKKIRKQAQMKGFRPGMVPIGLVKRMYGKGVMVEEIEKKLNESLQNYIKENEVKLLFSPLMVQNESLDFSIQEPTDFTFHYEVGLAPDFELNYQDKAVVKYNIETSEAFIQEELTNLRKRLGIQNDTDPPIEEEDILEIRLEELAEDGLIKEDGVNNETTVSVNFIKDETIKNEVKQLEIGQQISINLKKAFDREEDQLLKFMLGVEGEEAENLGMNYRLTLLGLKRIELADMSIEFFEQVYKDPEMISEEQFMERFRGDFKELSENRAEERLKLDIQDLLMDNINMEFPEDFMKKYFKQTTNIKESTEEEIEETIEKEFEYMNFDLTDEMALEYAKKRLDNQEYVENTYNKIMEERLFEVLFKEIKTEPQDITFEEFAKLS